MTLSDPIITLIIASTAGLLALSFKLCYSSKCKVIKCCCGEIQRDVDHETTINIENSNRNLNSV